MGHPQGEWCMGRSLQVGHRPFGHHVVCRSEKGTRAPFICVLGGWPRSHTPSFFRADTAQPWVRRVSRFSRHGYSDCPYDELYDTGILISAPELPNCRCPLSWFEAGVPAAQRNRHKRRVVSNTELRLNDWGVLKLKIRMQQRKAHGADSRVPMSRKSRDMGHPAVGRSQHKKRWRTRPGPPACRTSQLRALPLVFRDVDVCGSEESVTSERWPP